MEAANGRDERLFKQRHGPSETMPTMQGISGFGTGGLLVLIRGELLGILADAIGSKTTFMLLAERLLRWAFL